MELSKRQLGIGYLAATGVVFSGVILFGMVRAASRADFATSGVLFTGLIPAVSLASGHLWLKRFGFTDEQVWRIATSGAIGIGSLTLLVIGFWFLDWLIAQLAGLELLLITSNITFGGVAGVLVGALWESNNTARRYRERNKVLNRVLRHNLRNDINVIHGRLTLLERELEHECDHTGVIQQKIRDILRLSEQSRAIEQVIGSNRSDPERVNVVPAIDDRLDAVDEQFPVADVSADLPDEAWVYADDMVDTVVGNLIENAIEHNEGIPRVTVDVSVLAATNEVVIRIKDDGPGIPTYEREVLAEGTESALRHGSGMGLWLVKWFVDRYDGNLSIDSTDEGSVVSVSLPRARPPVSPETHFGGALKLFLH